MEHGLKFNICGLASSHLLNDEIVNLRQKVKTNISTALLYSCRYWAAHVRDAMDSNDRFSLIKQVKNFFNHSLLFWLEVMSLTNDIAAANVALLTLAASIDVSGFAIVILFRLQFILPGI
jgi:hypothetical protein